MKKANLTKQQNIALLITMQKELQTIFAITPELDKLKDGFERKKRIIEDITYLIKEGFKTDPETSDIYQVFNVKS